MLEISVKSARSLLVEGKKVITEISYRYADPEVGDEGIETAMRLPTEGIDIDGDGFIDEPDVTDLAGFVKSVNESLPGAEGCENAHLTLVKQLTEKNEAINAPKEPEEDYYEIDGYYKDPEEDDE